MIAVALLVILGLAAWRIVAREHVPHDGRNPVDLGAAIARLAHRGRGLDAR